MPNRSAHWAELVGPQIIEAFFAGYTQDGRRASMIPTIYSPRDSEHAFEEHLGIGVLSSQGWNFEDTGRVQYDEPSKGFKARFTHVEFAKGVITERKFYDDNRMQEKFDEARALGDSAFRKREKGAASVFTNAFTDTGVNDDGMPIQGPDGVGLCSTAHPRSQDNLGSTQSNEGTLALTEDNLATTRQLHMALEDDSGDIIDVMPDEVLLPPELEDTGIKLLRSAQEPGSANNAVNPQVGRFTPHVWHYLTDPNAWFTIDSSRRRQSLLWYDRIPLEFAQDGDFDTLMTKHRAYMRYSYGFRDWSWIYGQNPS